ncbi:MAG: PD-(D/E)XK nuclease family protein [Bryobacterales bacterium]|nr:PD-(D/E)XK nuclease family protein [Bryobacterales bacterium]
MTRRLAIGPSHEQRLAWAASALRENGSAEGALILAPSRGAADDFARRIAPGGALGIHRFTLPQLAAVLAADALAASGLAPLTPLGAEALTARAIHLERHTGPFAFFTPVLDTPGFARAASATIGELRLAGVEAHELRELGPAGQDLARLLDRYSAEAAGRGVADYAMLLDAACEAAARGEHVWTGLPLVLVDVVPASLLEQELVRTLAQAAPWVVATGPSGDGATLADVLACVPVMLKEPADGAALGRLRHRLFAAATPSEEPADPSVEVFSAGSEALECVEVARRALRLARDGVRFDEMAVLLRQPDEYLPLLLDALRRAGIPFCAAREALRPDPAGRAFLALLECALENLSAARFAEYLSLGEVPGDAASDGALRAPFAWERLLVEAAVVGHQDRWERRLDGLDHEFRLRLSTLDADDPAAAALRSQIERLEHLREFALPVIGLLAGLREPAVWGVWLDRLRTLAVRAVRHPEPVLAVLNELEPMAEAGPVALEEVRAVLGERLGTLRPEPPGHRFGRLFVAPIEEALGRSFHAVFLPGLAEGQFPRRVTEDPLLLDEARERLAAALVRQSDRVSAERLRLRAAAGAARAIFYASYPRIDARIGRARVPSFYALEVWRAAFGYIPEWRLLERSAASSSAARIGYPAPADPQSAIDDAEFDLAWLRPLLTGPVQRGAARYLLFENANLERVLRARGRRWRRPWTAADGLVATGPDDPVLGLLASYSLRERPYSASALQQFAACPYRFYLSALVRLRTRETASALEQLDPLTRGAIFHTAQRMVYREMEQRKMLPLTLQWLPEALDVADRVADSMAVKYEEELAPAIPAVWAREVEDLRTDLRAWLRDQMAVHALWLPWKFEFSFGLPPDADHDPASVTQEAVLPGGYRLRGAIDLVEMRRAIDIRLGEPTLRVTDHKTGRAPDALPRIAGGGEALQPLLYAAAAEVLLERKAEAGTLYYCTQRGNFARTEIPLNSDGRSALTKVLETIDAAVTGAFLPAAPRADACSVCDYRLVCGPSEERRLAVKDPRSLNALAALRGLP